MCGGMRNLNYWNMGKDFDVIEWNRTRHWVECHVIGHFSTRVIENLVELDTRVRNSVAIHMCVFNVSKFETWPRNWVQVDTSNF